MCRGRVAINARIGVVIKENLREGDISGVIFSRLELLCYPRSQNRDLGTHLQWLFSLLPAPGPPAAQADPNTLHRLCSLHLSGISSLIPSKWPFCPVVTRNREYETLNWTSDPASWSYSVMTFDTIKKSSRYSIPTGALSCMITVYAGRTADRNPRAMQAVMPLGQIIAQRFDLTLQTTGKARPVIEGNWRVQLQQSLPDLRDFAANFEQALLRKTPHLAIMGRCATALATLPVVARLHPDAAILYFDAHGDCNAPQDHPSLESAYLGGMVLTGAAGEWETGVGGDLNLSQVILVGCTDLDLTEQKRVDNGQIRLVHNGPKIAADLLSAIGNRPIYIHLDCDVLDAGLLLTEYQVKGGFSYNDLHNAALVLSTCKVIGMEISEYEGLWPDGKPGSAKEFMDAIAPLLALFK
jgi:arginase family enzyme